ncbi:MAG: hypothetical protein PHD82_14170, partial [Candidatus Riflebacteria bacterium]|nr:hypothetical protein [Candidatus Riflebacteria bacterium]
AKNRRHFIQPGPKKSNFQIFRDVQQAENSKTQPTKNSNAIFREKILDLPSALCYAGFGSL